LYFLFYFSRRFFVFVSDFHITIPDLCLLFFETIFCFCFWLSHYHTWPVPLFVRRRQRLSSCCFAVVLQVCGFGLFCTALTASTLGVGWSNKKENKKHQNLSRLEHRFDFTVGRRLPRGARSSSDGPRPSGLVCWNVIYSNDTPSQSALHGDHPGSETKTKNNEHNYVGFWIFGYLCSQRWHFDTAINCRTTVFRPPCDFFLF
jgi:hypothetical protein